ncbi:PspC domain-containing protein [Levilactobacillus bambusae]|uniref:Stress-responsive transcriptional regulator n=1 Tax=Levilactobacillus bambusae TaxID=2024736 RepID=A0A2V1MWK3_9LACO|nr:PspC domain-containing protein [Levilactobacillus bambusae]PWF99428.1 stress-responsive transcriptional regulator [Levilactobacillus bambusae]
MKSTSKKRFGRSQNNRVFAGVLGGIANYFGWNATLLRVIFVIITLGLHVWIGVLIYAILVMVMPVDRSTSQSNPFSGFTGFNQPHQSQQQSDRRVIHDAEEHDVNR